MKKLLIDLQYYLLSFFTYDQLNQMIKCIDKIVENDIYNKVIKPRISDNL